MSLHKVPLTGIERAGLEAHGLTIGKPSQLSDSFRAGVAYATAQNVNLSLPKKLDLNTANERADGYEKGWDECREEVLKAWMGGGHSASRPVDAFITVISVCTDLGQVKTVIELIDDLFHEHISDSLLSEDDWPKLTSAVSAAKKSLPEKERSQDRVARRYYRLKDELYRSGKITTGEAYVSMTIIGQCPSVAEFDAAIDNLLERDQYPSRKQSYFLRNTDELCESDSCDVCGGTGVFQGRKCDGIPF